MASASLGAPVQEAASPHGLRGGSPRDFRCGQCLEAPSGLSSRVTPDSQLLVPVELYLGPWYEWQMHPKYIFFAPFLFRFTCT